MIAVTMFLLYFGQESGDAIWRQLLPHKSRQILKEIGFVANLVHHVGQIDGGKETFAKVMRLLYCWREKPNFLQKTTLPLQFFKSMITHTHIPNSLLVVLRTYDAT